MEVVYIFILEQFALRTKQHLFAAILITLLKLEQLILRIWSKKNWIGSGNCGFFISCLVCPIFCTQLSLKMKLHLPFNSNISISLKNGWVSLFPFYSFFLLSYSTWLLEYFRLFQNQTKYSTDYHPQNHKKHQWYKFWGLKHLCTLCS